MPGRYIGAEDADRLNIKPGAKRDISADIGGGRDGKKTFTVDVKNMNGGKESASTIDRFEEAEQTTVSSSPYSIQR